MKTRIIIPARLKSTRFPNKLIKVFNGKSIIEHVALRAKKLNYDSLLIATDSLKIKKIDDLDIDGGFIESQAFGYLAIRSYLGLPITFPGTTGCKNDSGCTGGVLAINY